MNPTWQGIYSACFTPFTEDQSLDDHAFEQLCRAVLNEGQRGLYVCGTTGEGFVLEDATRMRAFRTAAAAASPSKARVIAHVGGVTTRRAVLLAREAAVTGCDAIAALPPYGGAYSYDELTSYYSCLAQATPLPLLVYHIPERSGYQLTLDQLSRWLMLPNVLGLKYSCSDLALMERVIARHPDRMIFHGNDNLLMHGLLCGATGAIGGTYNLTGPIALKIHAAFHRMDMETMRKAQAALNGFISTRNGHGGHVTMKALAAKRYVWQSGRSPLPSGEANAEDVAVLEQALDEALIIARNLP
jgi:N-acetylneuraminate lyase